MRPTAVLCAWIAAGFTLILLGHLKQQRHLARAAQQPVNHDFILGAQLPRIHDPDGSEPRERADPAGELHQG